MAQNDSIQMLLSARVYVYSVLQNLFGVEPSWEQLEVAASSTTYDNLLVFSEDSGSPYDRAIARISPILSNVADRDDAFLDSVKSEYTRMFIGPSGLIAPPWESVYRSKERVIFQASTLRVRNAYRAQGLLTTGYPRIADDHIAIELDFMSKLAQRALDAFVAGNLEGARTALDASSQFLDEHLLQWLPDFVSHAAQAEDPVLYPQLGILALQFTRRDRQALDELAEVL